MQQSILKETARALLPILQPQGLLGRVLGPCALAIGVLFVGWLPVSWWNAREDLLAEETARALTVAATTALGIPGETHAQWVDSFEVNRQVIDWRPAPSPLQDLREGLQEVAHMGSPTLSISTLLVSDKARDAVLAQPHEPKAGLLERMVSTEPTPKWRERTDYMPAMELALLQQTAVSSELHRGSTGRSIFAWAPIIDGFGGVQAIVQVEAPMDAALASLFQSHATRALTLLGILGGALCLAGLRLRRTTRALAELGAIAKAGVVEEPYLADDPTREVLSLTERLEARRVQEETTRQQLTCHTAHAEQLAVQAKRALGGHERFRQALAANYPTALRRVAGAVGRIPARDIPEEETGPLRESVLKACELARVLDQQRELSELRGGRVALKKSRVELRELIDKSVVAAREGAYRRGVDLRVVVGDGVPSQVQADEALLLRCLAIFTQNAVQTVARAGGGTVSVRVNRVDGGAETAVRFEWCDSAPGMSEAEAKVLYDPFPTSRGTHRRREHALDASLCVGAELLKLHGGELSLESVPGSGTRIAFTLSFASDQKPQRPLAAYPTPSSALVEGTIEVELGLK